MKKYIATGLVLVLFGGAYFVLQNYNKDQLSNDSTKSINNAAPKAVENNIPSTPAPSLTPAAESSWQQSSATPAIDFTLTDLNGNIISLSSLRGKNVFLNFWATWCPPCRGEMPDMEKIYQKYKNNEDFVILAVNLGEDDSKVKSFIEKSKFHFTVLLDSDQSVAEQYQITSIPTSYFIDKDGKITARHVGSMTEAQMESYVGKLMQ